MKRAAVVAVIAASAAWYCIGYTMGQKAVVDRLVRTAQYTRLPTPTATPIVPVGLTI